LTRLSSVDKYAEDRSIDGLLELDGEIIEVGGGYWVEIQAKRVPRTAAKPFGVDYGLCLISPSGQRRVCYDNAHPVQIGRPPSGRLSETNDHRHVEDAIEPYVYKDAAQLLSDFWTDVERILRKEGIP
jgi:Family of unknown function (DUF6516)